MADEFEKWAIFNAQVGEIEQTNKLAAQVVEVAITSLDPGPDDVVVFWLPADAGLAQHQVEQIANGFGKIIGDRFRFIVLVRHSVDIEIIKGKQGKSGVLLPS